MPSRVIVLEFKQQDVVMNKAIYFVTAVLM